MRRREPVPIAENISANRVISSSVGLEAMFPLFYRKRIMEINTWCLGEAKENGDTDKWAAGQFGSLME